MKYMFMIIICLYRLKCMDYLYWHIYIISVICCFSKMKIFWMIYYSAGIRILFINLQILLYIGILVIFRILYRISHQLFFVDLLFYCSYKYNILDNDRYIYNLERKIIISLKKKIYIKKYQEAHIVFLLFSFEMFLVSRNICDVLFY